MATVSISNRNPPSMTVSSKRPYMICTNCIMDTSDSNITFDSRGWCDYCNNYHQNILPNWHPKRCTTSVEPSGLGPRHQLVLGVPKF